MDNLTGLDILFIISCEILVYIIGIFTGYAWRKHEN